MYINIKFDFGVYKISCMKIKGISRGLMVGGWFMFIHDSNSNKLIHANVYTWK